MGSQAEISPRPAMTRKTIKPIIEYEIKIEAGPA